MKTIEAGPKNPKPISIEGPTDADVDLGELGQTYPLIPPGLYDVIFISAHLMRIFKGSRLITYWKISDLSSEHNGVVLIMGFQCPKSKKWGSLSKFAQCFRIAKGRDPDRFDTGRISTAVFKKKLFCAEVVTVSRGNDPNARKQCERSPENYYSVVKTLVSVKVG